MITRPMRRKRNDSPLEHAEQVSLMTWANLSLGKYPELKWLHAIANGGLRSKVTASKLKAEGVKPGVPDLMLPIARSGYHGLYIEMKRRKGTRPTPDQHAWIQGLSENGYMAVWSKGWEDARQIIVNYLDNP